MAFSFIPSPVLAYFLRGTFPISMRLLIPLVLLILLACRGIHLQAQQHYFLYRSARSYTLQNDSSRAVPPAIDSLLTAYQGQLQQQMEDTLACTGLPMTKAQPESTTGNLVADALLTMARQQDISVTAALLTYNSIGLEFIPAGPLTRSIAYRVIPRNDPAVILEVDGRLLQQLCDTIAQYKGWPLSGISFMIDSNKATGIKIAGEPLNPHFRYRIACNDFVTAHPLFREESVSGRYKKAPAGFSVTAALILYLQQLPADGNCLHPVLQNRISYAN